MITLPNPDLRAEFVAEGLWRVHVALQFAQLQFYCRADDHAGALRKAAFACFVFTSLMDPPAELGEGMAAAIEALRRQADAVTQAAPYAGRNAYRRDFEQAAEMRRQADTLQRELALFTQPTEEAA